MYHFSFTIRRYYLRFYHFQRHISSSSSKKPLNPPHNFPNLSLSPPQISPNYNLAPSPTSQFSRSPLIAISASVISVLFASVAYLSYDNQRHHDDISSHNNPLQQAAQKYGESFDQIFRHVNRTCVAASVLWKSLTSVLSSANHEVRSGFEIRVAALLADIAAANSSRRAAIVGAGGGAVVDWLLESVAVAKDGGETQAESARALAYLIADPNVSSIVLGRPHAIPNLLKFIFSCHPRQLKKLSRRSSFEASDSLKGRSMLVTAIMDIVTASCDNVGDVSFKPPLPEDADARDILAALQVVQEGCLHLDESSRSEDDEDGGRGWRGVGIKILEGTTVLGLSRTSGLTELDDTNYSQAEPIKHYAPEISMLQNKGDDLLGHVNMPSTLVPGLWDDLLSEHVAVPFATWALANWARASQVNRSCIQELDEDGCAIMSALVVPERSVRWHASLMAQALLEDCELPLNDFVSDLSSRLLSTISEACKHEDISLAQVSLSAFLLSIKRSRGARNVVMEKGVDTLRSITKQTTEHKQVQEAMAKALELLCIEELHFPLPEGQKWSGILLPWVFGKFSSDAMRSSAVKILSRILEDYGPLSVPVSQGWLALLLIEVQSSVKKSQDNGTSPKSDNAKSLIYNSNAASAAQVVNQLATAVVNLAAKQMESTASDSMEPLPLADFLSLDPFSGLFKKLKKDSVPKLDAANSALATLKGLKALTEVCTEDIQHQEMIVDLGVLCLLRRFLLSDDYEKLAANEAYNASRTHEGHERNSNIDDEPSVSDVNNSSSVRVPPTAHIRRHAARLLTILSNLPKVQKIIIADENWCKWLDECANGRVPGCQDLKIQSYARAALLNVFCNYQYDENTGRGTSPDTGALTNKKLCPRFDDYIFLINPHLPMWKCPKETDQEHSVLKDILATISDNGTGIEQPNDGSCINPINSSKSSVAGKLPSIDIVFVHGLRGGPFKSWRIAEDKSSTQSALVEKIDQEAGKLGTFWPGEWLSGEFPEARMFTLKYKTNLTQWSGASLPLQEVSSMLLEKLVAAGIGDRPVVFVTHSMGGLVVKQILHKAKEEGFDNLVNNSIGMVFYSCPHFGSRLADMPWRMGLVLRPAPSIGELRSGSSKLVELNDYIRHLHKKGSLDVLSFCETTVTPIVEGYGGWALRMEIVSIESAYPGFGELVVLDSTDHINSCKPLSRSDPSYKETLEFIRKLTARS